MPNTIKCKILSNGLADITLFRPQAHNALNAEMIAELTAVLKELEQNEQVRMVCLQGEGKSFCAGADLAWMQQTVGYEAKENFNDAHRFRKPVLALPWTISGIGNWNYNISVPRYHILLFTSV